MRKVITLLVLLMLAFVVACNKTDTTTTTTTASQTTTTALQTTTTEPDPDVTTVTIAHWGIGTEEENNLLRRRITMFNETHDTIQIAIVQHEGNWEEWLVTKAAAGEFPDVMTINNVSDYVLKDYIGDISSVIDEEWDDIPSALRDAVTYGEKIYAIPSAYHYMGYYANLDLLGDVSNATFNDFTYTADEFFTAIEALKDINVSDGTGTIGISNANDIVNWYPSVLDTNEEIMHFVWNGSSFDYNGDPMKDTIAKAAALQTGKYAFGAYSADKATPETPSERETIFANNWDGAVFRNNQMGFVYDASWSNSGFENDIDGLFDYDFVGVPDGKVIGVSDFFGVSKSAVDKEAAYIVAKYLTFGEQGITDAFDIITDAKTNEDKTLSMPGLPINETAAIITLWFNTIPQPGFKLAYEKAAAGDVQVLIEGNKYIPGFSIARFSYDTGIDALITRPNNSPGSTLSIGDFIYDASLGKINYSDYMNSQISGALNYELLKAQVELNNK